MNFKKIDQQIRHLNHRRIDASRAFWLNVFGFVFNPISRYVENAQHNILVLRLDDKLGDSLTATGFLRELKNANPRSRLVVVAGKTSAVIYDNLSFINEVIVAKKGFINTLNIFFRLNKYSFESIINTSHILTPRVIFLTSLLKAKKKLSFLNPNFSLFSDHVRFDLNTDHVSERYSQTLRVLGIQAGNLSYELKLPENYLIKSRNMLADYKQTGQKVVILNSFAGARLRNLNQTTTSEIVRGLLASSNRVVISIGNEGDLNIISRWVREFNDPRWIYFPHSGDLFLNCALVANADLIITPDTAWVHIASALKKKLVAIFRQDLNHEKNSLIWAPHQTQASVIISKVSDPQDADINSVSVDEVLTAANILLKDQE